MVISDSDVGRDALGFVLSDLLLLAGFLACATTVVSQVEAGAGARLSPEAVERSVSGLLDAARSDALASGEVRRIVIDPATSTISLHELGRTLEFGDDVALAAFAPGAASTGGAAAILFHPDGSSTGGTVSIRIGGAEHRLRIAR